MERGVEGCETSRDVEGFEKRYGKCVGNGQWGGGGGW